MVLKRDPNCTLCKLHKTAEYVCLLGQGPRQCDVMFVGEAPGRREDSSGKAFVGESGQLLEEILNDYGFEREDVFITNAVSCRPPQNRKPSKTEIRTCKTWLDYQIAQVKPKFICLLGAVPTFSITGQTGIKKQRGKPFERDGIVYFPTYHPAFILRDPRQEDILRNDIKFFREIVDNGGVPKEKKLDYHMVDNELMLQQFLRDLHGTVSYDIETNTLYPWERVDPKYPDHVDAKINTLGFGTKSKQYIIPWDHKETPQWVHKNKGRIVEEIDKRLDDCFIVAHAGKFDFLWSLVKLGVHWYEKHDFDTMLAHYVLDENDFHDLKYLAQRYLGAPNWDIDGEEKRGNKDLATLALYQAHDLFYTRGLRFLFAEWFQKDGDVKRVFDEILMPCSRLFVEIEYDGVCINMAKMADAEKYLIDEKDSAEKAMKKWGDINFGSTQQLADLLHNKLKIPVVERTKKGAISTKESVIKRINHPIARDILKFRGAKQQLSFFIDGWKPWLDRRNNGCFLHPKFKLHGTVTGRLSCEDPNLQQVPRDPRIRQLITAPHGWTFCEADLSQIELRVAAELSGERVMIDAFQRGIDIHWMTCIRELARGRRDDELILDTARTMMQDKKLALEKAVEFLSRDTFNPDDAIEVRPEWKEKRKKAKSQNFGFVYGMRWRKFQQYAWEKYDLILTPQQCKESERFYRKTFPDLPAWYQRQERYARRHGYVRTLSGRKRRLPEAMSNEDTYDRAEAYRQAINSPVQSFANEINLMSAIQLRREFGRDVVRIVGTVHDSILFIVKNGHVERVVSRLLQIMQRPDLFDAFDIQLKVPVVAEAKIGDWSIGISFDKWRKQCGSRSINRASTRGVNAARSTGTNTSRRLYVNA